MENHISIMDKYQLPSPNATTDQVLDYCVSFNAYQELGGVEQVTAIAEDLSQNSLLALRCRLFYLHRALKWGSDPFGVSDFSDTLKMMRDVIEQIRAL